MGSEWPIYGGKSATTGAMPAPSRWIRRPVTAVLASPAVRFQPCAVPGTHLVAREGLLSPAVGLMALIPI